MTTNSRQRWCFNQNGKPAGPVSVRRLRELLASGKIQPGQPVWREDGTDRICIRAELLIGHRTSNGENGHKRVAEQPSLIDAVESANRYQRLAESLQTRIEQTDKFLAILGHELRNPLTPILMALEILRKNPAERPDQHDARLLLERQVRKWKRLVDDLLEVCRMSNGKIKVCKELVDLRAIVERAVEAALVGINNHRHQLHRSIPDGAVWLDADPTKLEQVVVNLLANAGKYTPDGGNIDLIVACENGQATLRVRDSGIGIAPEMLGPIFEWFAQSERALNQSEGGLGVGLAIVKALVEVHGGTVEVNSPGLGQGSEFVVRLPLIDSGADAAIAGRAAIG